MTIRGFFRFDYTGKSGSGAGALAFVDGKIAGIDAGGGEYEGSYTQAGDVLTGRVTVKFPQGGWLVTGDQMPAGSSLPIPLHLAFTESPGQIFRIETGTGAINFRLTRISHL